jgi:hypothetical protein
MMTLLWTLAAMPRTRIQACGVRLPATEPAQRGVAPCFVVISTTPFTPRGP